MAKKGILDTLKQGLEEAKKDISKQWDKTKKGAKAAAETVVDAAVIDEENIPSKSIPRAIDKMKGKSVDKEKANGKSN